MRRHLETLAQRALATWTAHHLVGAAVRRRPQLAYQVLGFDRTREARFSRVGPWPESLDGFEDLAFLFSSNELNHGIALLTFDEGALLFQLARDSSTIVEIGRFKGGSTLLLAAAMPPTASVW